MARKLAAGNRAERLGSGALLAATVITVLWAGLGSRLGPQWYRWLFRHRPGGIVLHHTASGGYRNGEVLTAAMIDADHAGKGWGVTYHGREYHIGYHYIVRADGVVEPGRPETVQGAHTPGRNDYLGICLVGNFSTPGNPDGRMQPSRPTPNQMEALTQLVQELMRKYDLGPDDIYRHQDFSQTSCPGDRFPFVDFVASLRPTPASGELPSAAASD